MSRHQARSRRAPSRAPSVPTSADALALASVLAVRHDFLHAAAVLDGQHRLRDLKPFIDREHHTIETAIEWAWCTVMDDDRAAKLLLISVDGRTIGPREQEARELIRLRPSFADEGIDVLDWVWSDAGGVHSLAYALDAHTAWPTDPPALRAKILGLFEAQEAELAAPPDHHR